MSATFISSLVDSKKLSHQVAQQHMRQKGSVDEDCHTSPPLPARGASTPEKPFLMSQLHQKLSWGPGIEHRPETRAPLRGTGRSTRKKVHPKQVNGIRVREYNGMRGDGCPHPSPAEVLPAEMGLCPVLPPV